MAKQLIINLVGRICLVSEGGHTWALFLNAQRNRTLNLDKHSPLLSVPLSMVHPDSQRRAADARLTVGTFVRPTKVKGLPSTLIDNLGIWSLAGYDVTVDGVLTTGGSLRITGLPSLNRLVSEVDPQAKNSRTTFHDEITGPNAHKFGVLARLLLPNGASVHAVVEDHFKREFSPGKHKSQTIATREVHGAIRPRHKSADSEIPVLRCYTPAPDRTLRGEI